MKPRASVLILAATLALGINAPKPAQADEASTAAIAFGAAAIVGALLYDGNNRPYYVDGGRRFYVSNDQARWYRDHRDGYARGGYGYVHGGYNGGEHYTQREDHGGYRSGGGDWHDQNGR